MKDESLEVPKNASCEEENQNKGTNGRKHHKRLIVGGVTSCVVVGALVAGGAWFAFGHQPTQEPTAPVIDTEKKDLSHVSQKKSEKSEGLSAEEMTDEQLEASAAALEASGNTEAAQAVKSKTAEAPKVSGSSTGSSASSGSSSSIGSSSAPSGGGSSTPQPPAPNPAPVPTPEPAPAPEPEPPAHVHTWVPNVVNVYGDKCATCGEPNPSGEHSMNHALNGESDRVLNNVVIGTETIGSKCEGCGATK